MVAHPSVVARLDGLDDGRQVQPPRTEPSAGKPPDAGFGPFSSTAMRPRVSALSTVWLAMISSASCRTSGSRPWINTSRATSTAPSWCGIIMAKKSRSGLGVAAFAAVSIAVTAASMSGSTSLLAATSAWVGSSLPISSARTWLVPE